MDEEDEDQRRRRRRCLEEDGGRSSGLQRPARGGKEGTGGDAIKGFDSPSRDSAPVRGGGRRIHPEPGSEECRRRCPDSDRAGSEERTWA